MSKYIPVTRKVTSDPTGAGSNIVWPEHGTPGFWVPSDQATCPIKPVPVKWFKDYGWVSSLIFATFKL